MRFKCRSNPVLVYEFNTWGPRSVTTVYNGEYFAVSENPPANSSQLDGAYHIWKIHTVGNNSSIWWHSVNSLRVTFFGYPKRKYPNFWRKLNGRIRKTLTRWVSKSLRDLHNSSHLTKAKFSTVKVKKSRKYILLSGACCKIPTAKISRVLRKFCP